VTEISAFGAVAPRGTLPACGPARLGGQMRGRMILLAATLGAVLSMSTSAIDMDPDAIDLLSLPALDATSNSAVQKRVDPWIHSSMPGCMREKIEVAFQIAVDRVREVPECRALFEELGADGVEMLIATLYFPAPLHRQTTRCRHSFAIARVGSPIIWVCRKVTAHGDDRVAVALLHEALHVAGLEEDPLGRDGMCSGEINVLVMESCGF